MIQQKQMFEYWFNLQIERKEWMFECFKWYNYIYVVMAIIATTSTMATLFLMQCRSPVAIGVLTHTEHYYHY